MMLGIADLFTGNFAEMKQNDTLLRVESPFLMEGLDCNAPETLTYDESAESNTVQSVTGFLFEGIPGIINNEGKTLLEEGRYTIEKASVPVRVVEFNTSSDIYEGHNGWQSTTVNGTNLVPWPICGYNGCAVIQLEEEEDFNNLSVDDPRFDANSIIAYIYDITSYGALEFTLDIHNISSSGSYALKIQDTTGTDLLIDLGYYEYQGHDDEHGGGNHGICGDGTIDEWEQCDYGNDNGQLIEIGYQSQCSNNCLFQPTLGTAYPNNLHSGEDLMVYGWNFEGGDNFEHGNFIVCADDGEDLCSGVSAWVTSPRDLILNTGGLNLSEGHYVMCHQDLIDGAPCNNSLPTGMYVHFSVTTDEGDTNQPSLYTLDLDYLPEGTIYFDDDGYEPEFVIKGTGENLDTLNLNDSGSYPYHILQLQKGNCNEGEPQIQWTSQESPPQDIWNIELHIQSPQRFEMIFPIQGDLLVEPDDNWHLCLLENYGDGISELSSLYMSTLTRTFKQ